MKPKAVGVTPETACHSGCASPLVPSSTGFDGGTDARGTMGVRRDAQAARILDDATGGCIELEPVGEYTVRRRYISRTNVLQTTFTTPTGRARVVDAMVTGVAGRLPWAELARRIEGNSAYSEAPGQLVVPTLRCPWMTGRHRP